MYFAAFLMGLVGSLHCMGMCGPIAMMMPANKSRIFHYVLGRILYNFGRIVTYSTLGLIVGILGEKISFFASQKILSITVGILILIYFIIPSSWQKQLNLIPSVSRFNNFVKSKLSSLFSNFSILSQFIFGLLNGLLPCGMVYASLSGAFLMSETWQSALYMALFGLGTLPMMLSFSFLGNVFKKLISFQPKMIYTISYICLAIWLIIRGVNQPINHPSTSHQGISICK